MITDRGFNPRTGTKVDKDSEVRQDDLDHYRLFCLGWKGEGSGTGEVLKELIRT